MMQTTTSGGERQAAAIERWLRVFHPAPGVVVELRALEVQGRRAVGECFADLAALARRAVELDGLGAKGCYFTLNPLRPEMAGFRGSARAADVVRRHWLGIDADSDRPPGTNSTEAERQAAWAVLDRARGLLDAAGLRGAVVGDSGNGWHLAYPIDLPSDEASQAAVKAVLAGLAKRCDDPAEPADPGRPRAHIDPKVFDAPRIWKLYGTRTRKGPHSPDRPQRWARLVEGEPWLFEVAAVNAEVLRGLPQQWRRVEDMRRGRPESGEYLTPVQRAAMYVAKMPIAVQGQDGSGKTFEVAQVLVRGFALTEAEAWPLLLEYSARCQPPWSEKELRHKLADAQQKSGLPFGYLLGEAGTHPGGNGHANGNGNGNGKNGHHAKPTLVTPEPLPPRPALRTLPFPAEVFPPELRRFAVVGAETLHAPVDYFGGPMLAAASAMVGASRSLRLLDDYHVCASVYLAIVGDPSARKSPAMRKSISPVTRQHAMNRVAYKTARAEWVKAGGEGEEPHFVRTYTTDTTTEKLAELLAQNQRGLLLYRDEVSAWVESMDQYHEGGKGSDRQFYLSAWSQESVSVERKSNKDGIPVTVDRPFICVLGGVQPDALPVLSGKRGVRDGFLERILFCYPDPVPPGRWTWECIPSDARQDWLDAMLRLYALAMYENLSHPEDGLQPRVCELDAGAMVAWEQWHAQHQDELAGERCLHMRGLAGKLESYCARFALALRLLWHVCDHDAGFNPNDTPAVRAEDIQRAALLVRYFKNHARKAYGLLGETSDDRRVGQVIEWIAGNGGKCTGRDLYYQRIGGVRKASEAEKMLHELVDRGLGQLVPDKGENGHNVIVFKLSESAQ